VIATVLSPLAGYSYEKYGFAQSYLIMGLLVFCTTFISIFLLRSSRSSSGSDDVATLRYLNEKSEEYDVHRC
jgi:hypothetical protein